MSNQYFENNKNLSSNIQQINFYFRENTFIFLTDNGVFSKGGVDFGSSVLLKTIKFEKEESKKVLDVGCGYGPIGICIGKTYPNFQIDMVDVNERAIGLAVKNAENNKVNNVNIFLSNVYENINTKYDLILSNPPIRAGKNVVHNIICGAYEYLNEGGEMRCVIQQKQGAPSAIKALNEVFKEVEVITKDKGYWIISAKR